MRRGWADRPRAGRPRRLTEAERSKIIALGRTPPPGRLSTQADGTMGARDEDSSAQWSLDALAQAAKAADIRVKRSQIRLADLSGITPSPRDAATVI